MHIELVTTAEGLAALRDDWTDLIGRAVHASTFMTWEWQALWWKHYAAGRRLLRVFVVRDNAARVIGILPMYIERQSVFGWVPMRLLRNVGTGGDTSPDDLHPLVDRDRQAEVSQLLALRLASDNREYDVLRISDLAPGSEFEAQLVIAAKRPGWCVEASVCARMLFASLPGDWEQYLTTQSSHRRNIVRGARRKFLAQPEARFLVCDEPAVLERGIDSLIELHRLRWEDRAEEHAFASVAYCEFHREVMAELLPKNMLRLYALEISGRIVAAMYCYRFGKAVYHFQGGFDPQLSKLKPGLVLMGFAFEHAMQEGCEVFDMLRGEYEYKSQWAKGRRQTHQLEVFTPSARSRLYRLRTRHLPQIYRNIRPKRLDEAMQSPA